MRRATVRLGDRRSLRARAVLLVAGALLGCSALLSGEPKQCRTDTDCERLGFQSWTCDTSSSVCVSLAGAPGLSGASGVAGHTAAGSGGASAGASSAGAPVGGAGVAGNPSGGAFPEGGSSGTTGGASGSGGSAGGSAGSMAGAPAGGAAPIPDWPSLGAPASGVRLRVRSFCKQPVWVHAFNGGGALQPDDAKLVTNQVVNLSTPGEWLGGMLDLYGTAPRGVLLHEVGVSVSAGTTYFSLQYVQGYALPMEVTAFGGACSPVTHSRLCAAHEADAATCPEAFLKDGARCRSAQEYCSFPANQTEPYCHALDPAIAGCGTCPSGSTLDVYAGIGNYAGNARLGAALNRGMVPNPDSTNSSLYYRNPPYNTYAKWLHGLCPSAIAFNNDDFATIAPLYPSCSATELRVTLCPAR